jgi:hypothetical protein
LFIHVVLWIWSFFEENCWWGMMSLELGNSNNFTSSGIEPKKSVKNNSNDQIQNFPPNFKISSLPKFHKKFTKATMEKPKPSKIQ